MIQKIKTLVMNLFPNRGNSQSKFSILNFLHSEENTHPIVKHSQNVAKHLHKHHKKYIFGSLFTFAIIKLLLVYVSSYGFTLAMSSPYSIGNAIIEAPYEICDDGNIENGDGCSNYGLIEDGYSCVGEPSICANIGEPKTYGVDKSFWSSEPGISDIVQAYYGTQSNYASYRHNIKCDTSNMNIKYLDEGINTIPEYPVENTIYILSPGDYILNYMIKIENNCVAIVGSFDGVRLTTTSTQGANIKVVSGINIILDRFVIEAKDSGLGTSHTGNNYGVYLSTTDNTVNNINFYNHEGFGVYMEEFDNNISNVKLYKSSSLSLDASADTYINYTKSARNYNYGKDNKLIINENGTKSLLGFDLSSIPSLSKISSAKIKLTRVGGTANDFIISKVINNKRVEGSGNNKTAQKGETNYNYLGYPNIDRYGKIGMEKGIDYDDEAIIENYFDKKNTPKEFSFNKYGISALQEWIDYPELNRGFAIITDNKAVNIGSRENTNNSYRPNLMIEYYYEDGNTQNTPVILPRTTNTEIVKQIMLTNGYVDTGDNLVGTKPISFSLNQGNMPVSVAMESVDDQTTVLLTQDTKIKQVDGSSYTGIIIGPKNMPVSIYSGKISNQKIIKAFKIGSDRQKLLIKDSLGETKKLKVTVPIIGYTPGEKIVVSYSNDGNTLQELGISQVKEKNGKEYIEFQTDHFTDFILGKSNCSFVINNDEKKTDKIDVTLFTKCENQPFRMRFSNTQEELAKSERVDFRPEYAWTLNDTKGASTVYAEFDTNKAGKAFSTNDSIEYGTCDERVGCSMVTIPSTTDPQTIKTELVKRGYTDLGEKAQGDIAIDFSQNEGKLIAPVVLESEDKTIKVDIPSDTVFVKKSDGQPYTSTIVSPKEYDTTSIQEKFPNKKLIKAFKVGSTTDGLNLINQKDTKIKQEAIIKIPLDISYIGKTISVSYSDDGIKWYDLLKTQAKDDGNGGAYVEFVTEHFTEFMLGEDICSFVIDGDKPTTNNIEVNLVTECRNAVKMRFANDSKGLDKAERIDFKSDYTRQIAGTEGMNTVYAEFDNNSVSVKTSDSIEYLGACDPWVGCTTIQIPRSSDSGQIKTALVNGGYTDLGEKAQGSVSIDLSSNDGKLLTPVVLESADQSIKVDIPQDTLFIDKSTDQAYVSTLFAPKEYSPSSIQSYLPLYNILKAFKIGDNKSDQIILRNSKNSQAAQATIKVPVDIRYLGEIIDVAYSDDGITRRDQAKPTVKSDGNGGAYVEFLTEHFTDFVLGKSECVFVINNDDVSTNSLNVSLETICPAATSMRFSNDGSIWIDREAFQGSFPWKLDTNPDPGTHTVYAEFDDGSTTVSTQDTIDLSTSSSVCGNGTDEQGEACDDGNTNNGDGCSSSCQRETQSGSCTAKPSNTDWNIVSSITQTCQNSNGVSCLSWTPTTNSTYNTSPSTSNCYYKCSVGYNRNGASCSSGTSTGLIVSTGSYSVAGTVNNGAYTGLSNKYQIYANTTENIGGQSLGNILLSGVAGVSVAGSNWNGILYGPNQVTTGNGLAQVGETGIPSNFIPIQTVSMGGSGANLTSSGANFQVTIKLTTGYSGQILKIYYSNNGGSSWLSNTTQSSCTLNASNICTFQTNHFSNFTFLSLASSFFINSNASYTSGANVILNISVPAATGMRFSNNGTNRSSWISTAVGTTYDWILSGVVANSGEQVKTVYAEFIGSGTTVQNTDTIIVDTLAPIITMNSPSPLSGYYSGTTVVVGATIDERSSGLGRLWYKFDPYSTYIYSNELILMLNFDNVSALGESAGSNIQDIAYPSYVNPISPSSVTWTGNGRWNGAYSFNGSSSYISVARNVNEYMSSGFTISAWINVANTGKNHTIFSNYDGSATLSSRDGVMFGITNDDRVGIVMYQNGVTRRIGRKTNAGVIGKNTRYHVATIWNGQGFTGNNFKVFINGVQSDTTDEFSLTVTGYDVSTRNSELGRDLQLAGYTGYFDGRIDEVRIYSNSNTIVDSQGNDVISNIYKTNLAKTNTTIFVLTGIHPGLTNGSSYAYDIIPRDYVLNTTANTGGIIIIDTTPPSGTFNINSGSAGTSSPNVYLISTGIVGANFMRFANTSAGLSSAIRGTFSQSTGWTLAACTGTTYTVYGGYKDNAGNSFTTNDSIICSPGGSMPTLGSGYISSGSTGYNSINGTYYYKGTVNIRADVTNNGGATLRTGSCQYTVNGSSRSAATFTGNTSTGYCYVNSLTPNTNINIGFRISNTSNYTGYAITGVYLYDVTPPSLSLNGQYLRASKGGGTGTDQGYGVVVDSGGNTYIAGYFNGTGRFGSYTLVSSGYNDAFVAKLSSTGQYLRASKGGGTGNVEARGIAIDSGGNLYIIGNFSDNTARFGSYSVTNSGDSDVFVAKLSNTGQWLGAYKGGGTGADMANGISVDNMGNTYVGGYFDNATIRFGSHQLLNSGSLDAFIAKLSYTGQRTWASKGGGTDIDIGYGVAIDTGGNVYLGGNIRSTGYFGSIIITGNGGYQGYIAKLSSTGQYLRVKKGGGNMSKWSALNITVDSGGNSYMIGSFYITGYFGSITLTGQDIDPFIAKVSSTGEYLRAKRGGGINQDYGSVISTDTGGNVYIGGSFYITGYFGNTTLISSGDSDIFVAKLSSTGQYLRASKGGGTGVDIVSDLKIDAIGNTYMVGSFEQTGNFYPYSLVSSGSSDILVAKLGTNTSILFTINNNDPSTTSTNVTLNINCPVDTGVGGVQIAYGTSASPNTNWTGCDSTKPFTLNGTPGTKIVYMRVRDTLLNITGDYTDSINLIGFSAPTLTTGVISTGLTGNSGSTLYYRGSINIIADVINNGGSNLNTSSCQYTTGSSRSTASFVGNTSTGYCYASVTPNANINISFRISNTSNYTGYAATGTYLYDATASSVPTGLTPNGTYIATTTPTLRRNVSSDTGVGISGYYYQLSTGSTFGVITQQGTGTSTGWTTAILSNGTTYYWRVRSFDKLYNTSAYSATGSFTIDISAPTVSAGYISSGATGYNPDDFKYYYKGIIDIRGNVSDTLGLSTGTCMYTTGSTRASALYSGTSTTGYCYKTGFNFTSTLNIRFRIQDNASNVTTGGTGTYYYDATGPGTGTFTINNNAEYTNTGIVNLNISFCPSDGGVGFSGIYVGNSANPTTNFYLGCPTTITGWNLGTATGQRYVYIKGVDKLGNTGSDFSDYIRVDTANPQVGTAFIFYGTTGFNNPNNYYMGLIDSAGDVHAKLDGHDDQGLSGASCKYTTGGYVGPWLQALYTGTSTNGYCYITGLKLNYDIQLNFRVQDLAGNVATGTPTTYIYDGLGPQAPVTQSPTSGQNLNTGTVSLLWSVSIDTGTSVGAGIGTSGYVYQVSTGSSFTNILKSGTGSTTGVTITGLANNTYYRRVQAFDRFNLFGSWSDVPSFDVSNACSGNTYRWNNNNFITGAFWSHSPAPTNCDIWAALYGTSVNDTTAYTVDWSGYDGSCSILGATSMNFYYFTTGQDITKNCGRPNSICVLGSGIFNPVNSNTSGLEIRNCSAVVSTGTAYIQTPNSFGVNGMLYSDRPSGAHNVILDNLSIDGETYQNTSHYNNSYGITMYGYNRTINNINTYNLNRGMQIYSQQNNMIINNSNVYNNERGIHLGGTGIRLNNSKIFNNEFGISHESETYGIVLNNLQIFNNRAGIYYMTPP